MFNQIVIWLIASYVFIGAIPHTPAIRYLLLGALVVTTVTGFIQKRFTHVPRSAVILSFSAFVAIALLSAIASPYLIDSLQAFRKEYLPPLFILLVATALKQEPQAQIASTEKILWALLAGFILKTVLALWDGAINHPLIFSPYSNPEFFEKNGLPKYVSYYAVESVLYLTIAYATLLLLKTQRLYWIALALTCCTSLSILLASGIRSAFAAAIIGLLIITLLTLKTTRKISIFILLICTIAGMSLVLGKSNTEISRYTDLANLQNYSNRDGMSGRFNIWEGVAELALERPVLGFGPGWQKLPIAANDFGLTEKWRLDESKYGQLKHWYFSLEPGKVNPHNLALQVIFETGLLGLLAYLSVLATLFWSAFTAPDQRKTRFNLWLKYASIAYFAALFVIDITNAFLIHNTMLALMLITVLTRQSTANAPKTS